ncbi:MAG TPA: SRPBCC family protein [Acidimicrobiales bacterium]|nr:SRPBCC family protein [Acidimicrobiales bacterium]
MGSAKAEIDIEASPEKVWELVGNFGGIADWMPGLDACTVKGDDRTISMLGMEIVERLYDRDEEARSITYGIVGGSLSLDHHRATIKVQPSGTGSFVTWEVDVKPDNLTEVMEQTYQGSLDALKERFEK